MEFKFKSVQVIGVEGFDIKPSYYFHVHQALGSLSIFFLLLIMFTSILSIVSCAVPRKTTTGGERERDRERRSERDREGRTRREGGRERGGGTQRTHPQFLLQCSRLLVECPAKTGAGQQASVVRMRSGLPHAQAAQRFGIWAKCSARKSSTPRPPWPSIAGSLGFSARRVCFPWPAG